MVIGTASVASVVWILFNDFVDEMIKLLMGVLCLDFIGRLGLVAVESKGIFVEYFSLISQPIVKIRNIQIPMNITANR